MDTHPKHDVALGAVRAVTTGGPASSPRSSATASPAPEADPASLTPAAGPDVGGESSWRPRARVLAIVGAVLVAAALAATMVALRPGEGPDSAGVTSRQPSGATVTQSSPTAVSLPSSQALSRDELVVARRLDNTNWELYRANAASATPGRRLTKREGTDSAPVLSPDRKTLIYIRIQKDGLRTLRVAGAADLNGDRLLFALPAGCTRPLRPAWNPTDASMLAIGCRDEAGHTTLRLMRTDGTVVATVEPPPGLPQTDDLAFSSDGRRLGFWASSSEKASDGRLFSVAISGGTPEQIFTSGGREAAHDADLAFSPDGEHIAFSRRDGSRTDIMVARTDGSGAVPLITRTGHNQAPTWFSGWFPDRLQERCPYIGLARQASAQDLADQQHQSRSPPAVDAKCTRTTKHSCVGMSGLWSCQPGARCTARRTVPTCPTFGRVGQAESQSGGNLGN